MGRWGVEMGMIGDKKGQTLVFNNDVLSEYTK